MFSHDRHIFGKKINKTYLPVNLEVIVTYSKYISMEWFYTKLKL